MTAHIAEQLRHLAIPITSLVLDPSNARKHGERNLEAIKASLAKFGQRSPVVVQRDGMVVRSGNGRLLAAKALGWTEIAATIIDEDNSTAAQFAIADNRTAELAEWDNETLALLLDGWDKETRESVGFDEADLKAVMAELEPKEIIEDEVPEPPVNPITKLGDLWLLGKHRLLCGDSTKPEDVARVLDGCKPLLMVTDPPYGVEYDPTARRELQSENCTPAIGIVINDDRSDWTDAWKNFSGDVAYVWHAGVHSPTVATSLESCKFERRALICWAKERLVIGRGHYHHKHEPCWYVVRKNATAKWAGDHSQTTLWEIDKPQKSETGHSTQKPLECMARPIRNHDAPEVYDPFLGSGTTLIAAEQLGRNCYGMEISPAYCDVIIKRWETLTGKKAVLANG